MRKGKGETRDRSLESEWVMAWRGGEWINLFTSVKLVNSVRVHLVYRVWLSLTEFTGFRVFNLILHVIYMLTRKIIRFYESTRDFNNLVPNHKKACIAWEEQHKLSSPSLKIIFPMLSNRYDVLISKIIF